MPHLTVSYTAALAGTFDTTGFARDIFGAAAAILDADPATFKARFTRIDDWVIGLDGSESGTDWVQIFLDIASGRTSEIKAALAEAILTIAGKTLTVPEGQAIYVSADVRELVPPGFAHLTLG
ncbi:5-carboxymethyl-2-hydroxymuconate Delta-isomerase [Nocardia sp. NPDC003693]